MNVPKARQLKSGNWNVQVTLNGERYSITKPTKKEAEAEAQYRMSLAETGRMGAVNPWESKTPTEIMEAYIESNAYRLSPVTVMDYKSVIRSRFKHVMDRPWNTIDWERVIANEMKKYSTKTVTMGWAAISAAAKSFGLSTDGIRIKKPKEPKKEHAYLTEEQMKRFQRAIYGDELELACLLGLLSLRKSEIYGLRRKDVDLEKGYLHVCHTRIEASVPGGFIERDTTKTEQSNRTIPLVLNPRITELIRGLDRKPDDYVIPATKNTLYRYINRKCQQNNLPLIGVHGLRHTFASICWAKGVPMEVCMLYGGWASDETVRKIYQHLDEQIVSEHAMKLAEAFSLDGIDFG